jgi:hypothetical protein
VRAPVPLAADEYGHFYQQRGQVVEITDLAGKTTSVSLSVAADMLWPVPGGGFLTTSPSQAGVTAHGRDGAPRWSLGVGPGLTGVVAGDEHRLLALATPGGVLVVDAASGERRHASCGWGFGAWEVVPTDVPGASFVVCE